MVFRNTGIISWYLTYCFELRKQKQIRIKSGKDILQAEKNEIAFSCDMVWNWKKTPHFDKAAEI